MCQRDRFDHQVRNVVVKPIYVNAALVNSCRLDPLTMRFKGFVLNHFWKFDHDFTCSSRF